MKYEIRHIANHHEPKLTLNCDTVFPVLASTANMLLIVSDTMTSFVFLPTQNSDGMLPNFNVQRGRDVLVVS